MTNTMSQTIQSIPIDKKHILYKYYTIHLVHQMDIGYVVIMIEKNIYIFIYDFLNNKILHKHDEQFLKRLFPTYNFEKNPVQFPLPCNINRTIMIVVFLL